MKLSRSLGGEYLILIFFSLFAIRGKAQFKFMNLIKLKGDTIVNTYLVTEDPKVGSTYIDILSKYWTFSKVRVITSDRIRETDTSRSCVFRLVKRIYNVYSKDKGYVDSFSDIYLNLTYGENYIMRFGLCCSLSYELGYRWDTIHPTFHSTPQYDWSPGLLKNYIQAAVNYINNWKLIKPSKKIAQKEQLKKLRDDTLYIPDYLLFAYKRDFGAKSGILYSEQKEDIAAVMQDYKYRYRFIKSDELNKMLLDSSKHIYYMIGHYNTIRGAISIIDSQSGDILYSAHKRRYGLRQMEVNKIQKIIAGS
jgi:hypothetical protein